jgi:hypothetical protein
MNPRSPDRSRNPVSRPPVRTSARARPMDDTVDSMRIGGFVMLGLAAAQLVEKFVLSFWLDVERSPGVTAAAVLFDVVLGVAMLQGSNGARKVVLWLTALSAIAIAALMALLFAAGFGNLWPATAPALLVVAGVFLLNVSTEPKRGFVAGALALILVGWVGSVAGTIFLAGSLDLATLKTVNDWASSQRSYEDPEAGVAIKVPASWVMLKDGSPLAGEDKPLLTLASTEVESVAKLQRETRTLSVADNVEFFLDGLAKSQATTKTNFTPVSRADAKVGEIPARRMKATWSDGAQKLIGSFTAWQDGHQFYYLAVVAPRVISKRLDADVDRLERSVAFSAPLTAFLRERSAPTRQECPLLTDALILGLVGGVRRDAPPEAYCREAYRLAFVGQPLLDPAASQRLGASMKTFFAALPRAKSARFGAYTERLRAGSRTDPAEDKEMALVTRAAMETLAPADQENVRASFALAVEMGRFSDKMQAR